MKARLVFLAGLLVAALALAGCSTKVVTTDGAAPLYTVTAGGTGKVTAPPDMAEMNFGVTVMAEDAKSALGEASAVAESITNAVKDAGVAKEDIQTANVNVYPEQSGDGDRITITGYRASVQVRVKLRDLDAIGDVIGAANEAGANEIGGPTFMLSDDSETRNEAIELAIADARKRAAVMADAADKSLGEIVSVSETNVSIPPIDYDMGVRAAAESAVPIEPGQLDIATSVTVVFELK
ncbi:DUF541 domain-containing protein [bacterium]|nr:DUF541 domain-containing protein [bacterium]